MVKKIQNLIQIINESLNFSLWIFGFEKPKICHQIFNQTTIWRVLIKWCYRVEIATINSIELMEETCKSDLTWKSNLIHEDTKFYREIIPLRLVDDDEQWLDLQQRRFNY